jgi:hypothetical protein
MRISLLLISFIVLSSAYHAVEVTKVNLFIFDYLGENETFTKISFDLSDGSYYIVNITDSNLIIRADLNGSIAIITSKEEIRNALNGYYESQGLTVEDLKLNKTYIDELTSFVDAYNLTRVKEFECKRSIGIDRFPCVDLETCWRACYTPVCQHMKIGAGRPFLEMIWALYNSSLYIDSNLSTFYEKMNSTSQFSSLEQIDEIISIIDNIRNNSIDINNNGLLDPMLIGFCHLVDYNLTYLTDAKIKLLRTRDNVLPLLIIDETAEKMFNDTSKRISLKSQLKIEKLCSSFHSNASKELSLLRTKFSNLNTSKIREKFDQFEQSMNAECNGMDEIQIKNAQLHFSNLSKELIEYGEKLEEVAKVQNETHSLINEMQGDVLLYFKTGEVNSKFNEINAKIDSAELAQLPGLESQLIDLKGEIEASKQNKPLAFISGMVTSPLFIILIVIIIVAVVLFKSIKKKKTAHKR